MHKFDLHIFKGIILIQVLTVTVKAQVPAETQLPQNLPDEVVIDLPEQLPEDTPPLAPAPAPGLRLPDSIEVFSIPSTTRIHEVGFGVKIINHFKLKCIGGVLFDSALGGRPQKPSEISTQSVWEDLRSPLTSILIIENDSQKSPAAKPLEAQGWIKNKTGQISLSAQPNKITPIAITKASVPCRSLF